MPSSTRSSGGCDLHIAAATVHRPARARSNRIPSYSSFSRFCYSGSTAHVQWLARTVDFRRRKRVGMNRKHAALRGRLVMVGFGSIGKATLPLLLRHLEIKPSQVTIISRSPDKSGIAKKHGVAFVAQPLREGNYEAILASFLQAGDFLLNLSVEVSSLALMEYCWRRGILYL